MTEKYLGWLNNPDTRQILETYGADNLTEDQQAAFERVVEARWTPPHKYYKLLRGFRGGLKQQANTGDLVAAMRDVCNPGNFPTGGTNPHRFLGDNSSRFNLGYIQGQQELKE